MVFDGHLRVWCGDGGRDAEGDGSVLPALAEGEPVTAVAVRVERHVTQPPPRYTEAGLVRRLDELGIGRPSTWAAIVAVLQERDYAILHDRRFVPTERGRVATAFLEAFFGGWVETGFTAAMEEDRSHLSTARRMVTAPSFVATRGHIVEFWKFPVDSQRSLAGCCQV